MRSPYVAWIISLRSLGEFKRLNVVAFCGMMCALAMVLNMVASINVGPYVRIGFSGIPNQVVAYLFGPAVGGIFGAALDVIKYLIKPDGAFFPGFTVSAALGGIIYGAFLYKKKVTLPRVFASQLLVKIAVNILLNTLWLNMLYGKAFLAILPGRVISNAVMLPIDTAIMFFMLQAVDRTIAFLFCTLRSRMLNISKCYILQEMADNKEQRYKSVQNCYC